MGINVCLVSGGKDSQACAIYCMKNNIDCEFVFSDTGWEDEDTYKFLEDFEKKLPLPLTRLIPDLQFVELAAKKKRFPSTKAKFCTEYLKVRPFIDWRLNKKGSITVIKGIRWAESTNRKIWKNDPITGKRKQVGIPSIMEVVFYVNNKGYGSGLFTGSYCQNQMLPCE